MDRYQYENKNDEEYQLEGCNAIHSCVTGEDKKGWCIEMHGHQKPHTCGRCASLFSDHDDTYTREEILDFLSKRIEDYQREAGTDRGKSKRLGYVIDELLSLSTIFALDEEARDRV
jgi:hypothetical protein